MKAGMIEWWVPLLEGVSISGGAAMGVFLTGTISCPLKILTLCSSECRRLLVLTPPTGMPQTGRHSCSLCLILQW